MEAILIQLINMQVVFFMGFIIKMFQKTLDQSHPIVFMLVL